MIAIESILIVVAVSGVVLGLFAMMIRTFFYFKYRSDKLGDKYCDKCLYFSEGIGPIIGLKESCSEVGVCRRPGNYKMLNRQNLCKKFKEKYEIKKS